MTSESSQLAQIQPREVLSSCETQHTSTPATYAKPTLTNLRMQQQSLQQANRNHDPVIFIEVAQTAKGNVVIKRDCMAPDVGATQPTASTRSHQQANGTMTSESSQLAQIQPREVLSSCETQHTSTPAAYAKPTLTNLRRQQQSLQQANRNHDPVIFIEVAPTAKGNFVIKQDCMGLHTVHTAQPTATPWERWPGTKTRAGDTTGPLAETAFVGSCSVSCCAN